VSIYARSRNRGRSRRDFLATFGWTGLSLALSACTGGTRTPERRKRLVSRPNFVLIFCDDLGYGDVGCFGSAKNRTPNIDRLAAEGMRLTSFYSTSGVCTPSRASLMTGCYPRRVNMHQDPQGDWVLFPVSAKGLHPGERTIAEVLKTRGYRTACIGKWHLGDQLPFLPTRQGFDEYFGIPYSNDMGAGQRPSNPPLPLLRDEEVIEAPVDQDTLTRRYTEEAVRFIRHNRERPFFLYLAHTMPHAPIHVHPDFRGRSLNGLYGDAVEELDWSTGEILKALGEERLEENTLLLFTSDNGATRRGDNGPLSGYKGSTMEGGMRVPCLARWIGKIPAGKRTDAVTSTMDFLPTLAALAGADIPKKPPLDGHDIRDLLLSREGAESPYEAFFYYFMGQLQAVRSGPWKLHLPLKEKHHGWHGEPFASPAALYDLSRDIGERTNLIDRYPKIAARLADYAERAREDIGDLRRQGRGQRPAGWVRNPRPLVMSGRS